MFPLSPYHLPKPYVEVGHSVNEISKSVRSAFTIRESRLLHILPLMLTSLHICETGRTKPQEFKSRFIEHLRSIRKNTPGFSVAQHFNSTDHSISDVQVRGVALCSGSNFQRKQHVRLILQLGTIQLKGLNINFSFI